MKALNGDNTAQIFVRMQEESETFPGFIQKYGAMDGLFSDVNMVKTINVVQDMCRCMVLLTFNVNSHSASKYRQASHARSECNYL